MDIRAWAVDDLSALALLADRSTPHAWSVDVLRDCFKATYQGWVLEDKNKIIGFIVIFLLGEECELLNICIDPEYRRQGLGQRLMDHVIEYSQSKNLSRIYLEVRDGNQHAIDLYHACGFGEVGVRKDYYPCSNGREDARLMVKIL